MRAFSFGSRKPDPVEERKKELEAKMQRLQNQRDELQRELEQAANPPEPEELREPGPPIWRSEEEWESLSDRTSVTPRQQRDKRIRDRNQFVVLGFALLVVLALIFWVLWP